MGKKLAASLAALAAATAAVALAGCANGPSSAEQSTSASAVAQTVFLQQWHEEFPAEPSSIDGSAVNIGHSVCDAYKAGTTFVDEVAYLRTELPSGILNASQAGAVIGMSTASFCPQYNQRH